MGTTTNDETKEIYLVMEYMKNGSLHDLLFKDKITLQRADIVRIALDVARGLHYLHNLEPKIVHRDLKSANVLVNFDNFFLSINTLFSQLYSNGKRAKISDFGTARLLNTSSVASSVVGTFGYMAPELIQEEPYNEKADIYS